MVSVGVNEVFEVIVGVTAISEDTLASVFEVKVAVEIIIRGEKGVDSIRSPTSNSIVGSPEDGLAKIGKILMIKKHKLANNVSAENSSKTIPGVSIGLRRFMETTPGDNRVRLL